MKRKERKQKYGGQSEILKIAGNNEASGIKDRKKKEGMKKDDGKRKKGRKRGRGAGLLWRQ